MKCHTCKKDFESKMVAVAKELAEKNELEVNCPSCSVKKSTPVPPKIEIDSRNALRSASKMA